MAKYNQKPLDRLRDARQAEELRAREKQLGMRQQLQSIANMGMDLASEPDRIAIAVQQSPLDVPYIWNDPRGHGRRFMQNEVSRRSNELVAYDVEVDRSGNRVADASLWFTQEMDFSQMELRIRTALDQSLLVPAPVLTVDSMSAASLRRTQEPPNRQEMPRRALNYPIQGDARRMVAGMTGLQAAFASMAAGMSEASRGFQSVGRALRFAEAYGASPRTLENLANRRMVVWDTEGSIGDLHEYLENYGVKVEKPPPPDHPETGKVITTARRLQRTMMGLDVVDIRNKNGSVDRRAAPLPVTMIRTFKRRNS